MVASWATGGYHVAIPELNPKTVPYVNAFVRDHGVIDKYWRTGAYRFRPVNGITLQNTDPNIWDTFGTPVPAAAAAPPAHPVLHEQPAERRHCPGGNPLTDPRAAPVIYCNKWGQAPAEP